MGGEGATGAVGAKGGDGVGIGGEPPGVGDLEATLENVAVAALDQAGTGGETRGEGRRIVELIETVFEDSAERVEPGPVIRQIEGTLHVDAARRTPAAR